jgi:hypothetical protein
MPLIHLQDDPIGVPDGEVLLRRVAFDSIGGNRPAMNGQVAELSENAFRDYSSEKAAEMGFDGPCMSIGILSVLISEGRTAADWRDDWGKSYGIARFTAGQVRQLVLVDAAKTPCPQGVMASPTDAEPWHGVVFDLSGVRRKASVCKRIKVCAEWEVPLIHTA